MTEGFYAGIVAEVPFVDVVTTMSDPSVPLTTLEYNEWGNPAVRQEYDYMLSYSPYDNVTRKNYPAMFVTAGFHDNQVSYVEPAKWVARLRASKTDPHRSYSKNRYDCRSWRPLPVGSPNRRRRGDHGLAYRPCPRRTAATISPPARLPG